VQAFILAVFCCATLAEFLVKVLDLPPILRFLPEAMSVVVTVCVLVAGMRSRFRLVAPKYLLAFTVLTVVVVCGTINNKTGAGPLLSGARFYLRSIPMFFLPAVLPMTDVQIKRQLRWILALALVQVPVAVYQQWVIQSQGRFTGDDVKGTVQDSGILSLFLICCILVLTGLLLRRRIRPLQYWLLFFVLLIPTTINETKVTVIFLPLGLLATVFLGPAPGKKLKYLGMAVAGLVVAGALFIPIYSFTQRYNPHKNERDITSFFSNQKQLSHYFSSGVGGVGTKKDVRRGDAIVVPFQYLARDPVQLMFGLGMGAVSPSKFGKNFEGPYYLLFTPFLITSFSVYLLEFGLLGLAVIGVLFWMVFWDTLAVARSDESIVGALAIGWTGVVVLFALSVVYSPFHEFTSVNYMYGYFSGLLCARRLSLAYERSAVRRSAAHASEPITYPATKPS
jgi:hypothetical protein